VNPIILVAIATAGNLNRIHTIASSIKILQKGPYQMQQAAATSFSSKINSHFNKTSSKKHPSKLQAF
jgi:hypothetical protein